MRKSLLAILLLLGAHQVHSQLPDGSIAPNFTAQDIHGNWHTLYDYLDEGKTVIINIISTAVNEDDGQSWLYFAEGSLMTFQSAYGPNGDNSATVLMIETDPKTPESALWGEGNTIGDWEAYANFPIISSDALGELYPAGEVFPSNYIICPNRRTKYVEWTTSPGLHYYVGQCQEPEYFENARVKRIVTPNLSNCGLTVNPEIVVENLGFNALTSLEIEYSLDNTLVDTYRWTGEISMYTEQIISLPAFDVPNQQQHLFSVTLTAPNDVDDEETSDNFAQATFHSTLNGEQVLLTVETDNHPEEIEWRLLSEGNLVVQAGNYTESNYRYDEPFCIAPNQCYSLVVNDNGHNGMQVGSTGGFTLSWNEEILVQVSGDEFTDGFREDFCLTPEGTVSPKEKSSIEVYPNPASDKLQVKTSEFNRLVRVVSVTGQVVLEQASTTPTTVLYVDNLPSGIYYILIDNSKQYKPVKVIID
ncbi:MAG: T9SS type A sorting domain-containing protein [Salinivirgaceae bacterium]